MSKKALVVGLGASGLAAIEYLVRRGWSVEAADTREAPPNAEKVLAAHPGMVLHLGGLPETLADGIDLLVMSPGVSPYYGAAAALVARARARGVDIAGEIELFARELSRLKAETGYAPKVIGITGTNGKTTTTSLTAKMMAQAGFSTVAAGNIGPNAVTELLRAEDEGKLPDCWVLELSSFQLETTATLRCDAAALLNVTEDHIDWHGSLEAYAAAKARIFSESTVRVVNRDDGHTLEAARHAGVRAGASPKILTFGADSPEAPGEYGLVEAEGLSWLAFVPAPEGETLAAGSVKQRSKRVRASEPGAADVERLMPEDALLIRGRHNAMNALAAVALATAAGASLGRVLAALAAYKGEPHRVEYLRTVDGVDFIDDSKGTNVGAVAAAVKGFAAQKRRILIVLGGDGKGQDFSPLAEALAGTAGAVALIGQDARKIGAALDCHGAFAAPKAYFETLEAAVDWLWTAHRPGDVLLLSPACASWDMFRNYAHRSAVFAECAARIAADLGAEDDAPASGN